MSQKQVITFILYDQELINSYAYFLEQKSYKDAGNK